MFVHTCVHMFVIFHMCVTKMHMTLLWAFSWYWDWALYRVSFNSILSLCFWTALAYIFASDTDPSQPVNPNVKRRFHAQQKRQFWEKKPFQFLYRCCLAPRGYAQIWLPSIAPRAHLNQGQSLWLWQKKEAGGFTVISGCHTYVV